MAKSIRWTFIFIIFFMTLSTVCFATDIDMNLNNSNVVANEDSNSTTNTNETANTLSQNTQNNSTTISSVSSEEESTLSLNAILNILLIVVGIVLILLGIAILIRLKS